MRILVKILIYIWDFQTIKILIVQDISVVSQKHLNF